MITTMMNQERGLTDSVSCPTMTQNPTQKNQLNPGGPSNRQEAPTQPIK